MLILLSIIALYVVAALMGKRSRQRSRGTYLILFVLALMQACIMLIDMFSKHVPDL